MRVELPEQPVRVRGNDARLRQIIMNLLVNAADAVESRGGRIHVRVHRPEPGTNEQVLVEVEDDGCGMSPETRARIFDPFFSTKAGGRGIGLAAARRTIESMGGRIVVDSELGVGTSFWVWLEASPEGAAPSKEHRDLAGRRLLVADDEDFVRPGFSRGCVSARV